jgi:RimJ/RimL family protein N-acetyltransferase
VGLATERLILRRWAEADRDAFAAINMDPYVMATLGPLMSREASDAFVDRIEACFEQRGWGLWCVEVVGGPACIGYVGLWPMPVDVAHLPEVEIGWRIASEQWGKGYAPEAAQAVLGDAFTRLGLDEVGSITALINDKSRRVMEKIGLVHDPTEDFDHPRLAPADPLVRHVLYRTSAIQWRESQRGAK